MACTRGVAPRRRVAVAGGAGAIHSTQRNTFQRVIRECVAKSGANAGSKNGMKSVLLAEGRLRSQNEQNVVPNEWFCWEGEMVNALVTGGGGFLGGAIV